MKNSRFRCFAMLIFMSFCIVRLHCQNATAAKADVGVILDLDTTLGKMCRTCISMAVEDFYSNNDYTTMIVPHFRDSSSGIVAAASAAISLLKSTEVMAILGSQTSLQADFVMDIGEKVKIPIISPATSPSLSPQESPYFIRSSWSSASQAKAVAAIVIEFGWREVVFIYEDKNYGSGLVPFLTEELVKKNAFVSHQSAVSSCAENDRILQQLYELKKKQTRVFVVHMPPPLASRFFQMVKEAGMMNKGYAWIIADPLTSLLDSETIEAMQGVVGVKAYVPKSDEFINFRKRWSKRFHKENPEMEKTELNVFGLWAYDSIAALAEGVERVGVVASPKFKRRAERGNLTDLEAIGTSNTGPSLAPLIRNFKSKGLSGEYNISDGQLQPSAFEIVNVIGNGVNTVGFWTEQNGISKELNSAKKDDLAIIWPGQTTSAPKGWEFPSSGKKLKVGVPLSEGFGEFVKVEKDAETNGVKATGFCIDVFEEVLRSLPYADEVQIEYIPFGTLGGQRAGYYDDLVYEVFLQNYDAVVGDVTILGNRSRFVDFTVPYTEPGVAMIVPIKDDNTKNAWIFMKPLTVGLWLTIGAFFVFTGFVVWVLEHRVNKEFRGPPMQQVGTTLWFSFSTLVSAHRENVISNLTRFVVIVWLFVVLVLTSSYNASLTSMLTIQQLKSKDMIKKGEYVGYQKGSLVTGILKGMISDYYNIRPYSTLEEYEDALSKGSRNGGAAAIVDEIPYLRLLLRKYCHKYAMINPTYKTSGFGFAFRKGSPLVSDFSTAILNLKETGKIDMITRTWFGAEGCSVDGLESLDLDRFTGLFFIAGLSSSTALAIFLSTFLYENRHVLASSASIKKKMHDLARAFVEKKQDMSKNSETDREIVLAASPLIRTSSCDQEGIFSQDEGLSTIEIEMQEANS